MMLKVVWLLDYTMSELSWAPYLKKVFYAWNIRCGISYSIISN